MSKTHELKILTKWIEDIFVNGKCFEIRRDDRGYEVDDMLVLSEWSEENGFTGAWCEVRVRYIARCCPGVEKGYCVMAFTFVAGGGRGHV